MLREKQHIVVPVVPSFEEEYLQVRSLEQRLYPDEVVRTLPAITPDHPHVSEWLLRSRSSSRLTKYLLSKSPGKILEIGCGNGWLSNLIATLTEHSIVATDINTFELEQGMRLFKRNNLEFRIANGIEMIPGEIEFDYILFAAAIQYFPSLPSILNACLSRLSSQGEIHIVDTRFYKATEVAEARERTRRYYQSIGYPRMISNYFHHSTEELKNFRADFLYHPDSFVNRLTGSTKGFPWIRISKSKQKH